ncbi:hypothetical protein AAULR_25931, partial [Lacticaseibacillus rhamnosus MTCC 5462]
FDFLHTMVDMPFMAEIHIQRLQPNTPADPLDCGAGAIKPCSSGTCADPAGGISHAGRKSSAMSGRR